MTAMPARRPGWRMLDDRQAAATLPRSRLALLTWHFFRRFLDNDLISPNGDAHVGISHAVAALVSPTLLVTSILAIKYALMWRPTWDRILQASVGDGLLFISVSMIVLGVAAAVTWDAFFLDARDRDILSVLPVPGRLLSAAKLGALGLFLCVFVAAVNVVPMVLVPPLMVQGLRGTAAAGHFLPVVAGQVAALALAGAWAVLAIVALRGLLPLVLPARLFQRLSPFVQGLLVLALLAWTLSLSPFLDAAQGIVARGGPARDLAPPLWFLGLYEWIIGNPWPEYEQLGHTALAAVGATLALVLAVFFLPGHQRAELLLTPRTSGLAARARRGLRGVASRLAVRHPVGRASFAFTISALARSTKHRLYVAGAVGAGLAWAATGLLLDLARNGRAAIGTFVPSSSALQVQAVLVLFLVVAVRFGVLVPASLPANWLFRVTERRPLAPYFVGARRAALAVGLLPVVAFVPLSMLAWNAEVAAWHALVGVLYAAFVVELFFNTFAKAPCAAAYVSGSLKLKSRGVYYLVGASALSALPSFVESLAFRGAIGMLTLPLWLAAFTGVLAAWRLQKERRLPGLVFDDPDDEAFQTLRLTQ